MEISLLLERKQALRGYVKSFDGTKLFYSLDGVGKPLIFCYGLVCSSLHWSNQVEHFRKSHQTLWFDYRGHQNSEIPKNLGSLTLSNIAMDLRSIMDELNIPDAVLLGHSMGVNVVLEFYRQNPSRVAAMVLANGTAQRPLETLFGLNVFQKFFDFFKKAYRRSPKLVAWMWRAQRMNPLARSVVAYSGFNSSLTPQEDIDLYLDQLMKMDPSVLIHLLENYESYDASAWLHLINVPTLIMGGAKDRLTPINQQKLMHQLIPGSRLEVIRHGSHCPQMDLPDLVNLRVEKFLAEIGLG